MENQNQPDPVFVSGMYLNKVNENAPAFIITNQSIHVEQMIKWLQENRMLANENGYINITGKESQGGKRYFQLDTWVPKKQEPTGATETAPEEEHTKTDGLPDYSEENIPF